VENQNGVFLLEVDDAVPPGASLPASEEIRFVFGVKLMTESNGSRYWLPGSQEDFIRSEMKRTGSPHEEIEKIVAAKLRDGGCYLPGPPTQGQTPTCKSTLVNFCYITPHVVGSCKAAYDDEHHYWYCVCG
jgi:hypothetical protein